MRVANVWYGVAIALVIVAVAQGGDYYDKYYDDPAAITAERDGKIVHRVACERIPLDFPELKGRAEAQMALDSKGDIWAAIGCTICKPGVARLFHSQDEGKTWTSQLVSMPEKRKLAGFTVLHDGSMLMVMSYRCEDIEIYVSRDKGKSWDLSTALSPAPFSCIGEGTESITQLRDGRVLFPVARFSHPPPRDDLIIDKRLLLHSFYASSDGGKTFPVAYSTFRNSMEAHVIELQSGKLLAAFRHQRWLYTDESVESVKAIGGIAPGATCDGTPIGGGFVLKNVFMGDSEDGGVTWKNFRAVKDKDDNVLIGFGECYGRLVQVPDGRVVLVHDRRYARDKSEIRARVSRDDGKTWDPAFYHLCAGHAYPSSVALKDGTIVTIAADRKTDAKGELFGSQSVQAIRWKLP